MNLASLVLAAGLSRRFGSVKALAPMGRSTLIEGWVRLFKEFSTPPFVVVNNLSGAEIKSTLSSYEVQWVTQSNPSDPLFSSICLGLRQILATCKDVQGVLLTPVDVLPPSEKTIRQILNRSRETPDAVAIRPQFKDHWGHPVFLSRAFCKTLLDLDPLSSRLDHILNSHPEVCALPVDDPRILTNFNEPPIDMDFGTP